MVHRCTTRIRCAGVWTIHARRKLQLWLYQGLYFLFVHKAVAPEDVVSYCYFACCWVITEYLKSDICCVVFKQGSFNINNTFGVVFRWIYFYKSRSTSLKFVKAGWLTTGRAKSHKVGHDIINPAYWKSPSCYAGWWRLFTGRSVYFEDDFVLNDESQKLKIC